MNTPKPEAADVIRVAAETLDAICTARGIKVRDLDDAMIDELLRSSTQEYLVSDTLIADIMAHETVVGA